MKQTPTGTKMASRLMPVIRFTVRKGWTNISTTIAVLMIAQPKNRHPRTATARSPLAILSPCSIPRSQTLPPAIEASKPRTSVRKRAIFPTGDE